MHGGSGLDADEYRASIAHGVRKINYYTYAAKAALDAARPVANDPDVILFPKVAMAAREGVRRDVAGFVAALTGA